MFSVAPVCQFVCQFQVCQFVCLFVRTITFERFNIRWWNLALRCIAQKSRASSNVKVEGQRSRGQKTKKCGILFRRLGHGPSPVLRRWKKSAQKNLRISTNNSLYLEHSTRYTHSICKRWTWNLCALPMTLSDPRPYHRFCARPWDKQTDRRTDTRLA